MATRKPSLYDRVWSRAEGHCEYCQLPHSHDPIPFHVDHIISKKHRGRTVMTNLALSCAGCNLSKASNIAGLDDETGELARLFNPRTDVWIDHFARVEAKIVGISAIGRSTVGVLNMNQPERIRLRALLIRLGVLSPN